MADREKVIKGLETCSDVYYGADGACSSCPYSQTNGDRCLAELVHDAIDLLKEQEAVEPIKQTEQTEWTVCGHCRKHLISKWMFCPYCGRAVKWE